MLILKRLDSGSRDDNSNGVDNAKVDALLFAHLKKLREKKSSLPLKRLEANEAIELMRLERLESDLKKTLRDSVVSLKATKDVSSSSSPSTTTSVIFSSPSTFRLNQQVVVYSFYNKKNKLVVREKFYE